MRHLRHLCSTLAACLCAFGPTASYAQFMTNEWVITPGGGLSDPTGVFEEQMQTGAHATLSVGRHFNPGWLLGLRAGYFPFDSEPEWFAASGQDQVRFWNLDLEFRLILYPESTFTPYLVLGSGAVLETQLYVRPQGETTVDVVRPGATGGVGLSYHRERSTLALYTELVYQHFPSEDGSRQFVRWTSGLRISLGGRPF